MSELSDAGRESLQDHNLLAAEETLQQIYETISGAVVSFYNERETDVVVR